MSAVLPVVGWLAGGVLSVAALLTLVRVVRGPGMLDRVVAMDVLVSITVCALGVEAAVNRHTTTVPILIALSLVGFVGAVGVARFAASERDEPPPETGTGRTCEPTSEPTSDPTSDVTPTSDVKGTRT